MGEGEGLNTVGRWGDGVGLSGEGLVWVGRGYGGWGRSLLGAIEGLGVGRA